MAVVGVEVGNMSVASVEVGVRGATSATEDDLAQSGASRMELSGSEPYIKAGFV